MSQQVIFSINSLVPEKKKKLKDDFSILQFHPKSQGVYIKIINTLLLDIWFPLHMLQQNL